MPTPHACSMRTTATHHQTTPEVLRYSAFTDTGKGGNPAGVVLDADALTETEMLAIACAIGYSETAFVGERTGPTPRIRYFSPKAEVAFCGHATIASAVAIADRDGEGPLAFVTAAGPVPVLTTRDDHGITATLTSPPASTRLATDAERNDSLDAIGWTQADLDPDFPAHVAFAGNHHLVLGVSSRETLASFDYDYDALAAIMAREGWTTVHAFWAETPDVFHARNAFPPGGVREDPATGAAAAAFGGYLRELHRATPRAPISILQGEDMGSPSRLTINLVPGSPSVQVSGTATRLALSPYDDLDSA